MASTDDILIEIGTEELPPKALLSLSQIFAQSIQDQLQAASISFEKVDLFATPRRLAVLIQSADKQQPEQIIQRTGPTTQAAFAKNGEPTQAALGFARACGTTVPELGRVNQDGTEKLYYQKSQPGAKTSRLIAPMIERALAALPIPKRMRWGTGKDLFVRPVQWLVLMLGKQVVDAHIMGQNAGNITFGHRFHAPTALTLGHASEYPQTLRQKGYVEPDFQCRRDRIHQQINEQATKLGGIAVIRESLLIEVTALVEWPIAITGRFDSHFLEIPKEALITTMESHQKYFPVLDAQGQLMPAFIAIANIDSRCPEIVIQGNERVIRPRFADAEFFWKQDQKQPLEDNNQRLKGIIFEKRLGSVYDKVQRVTELCGYIAKHLNINETEAQRAGLLSKADLVSAMVEEFASMQGVAGKYYAQLSGESDNVAIAIEEQYLPRFSGDQLPQNRIGQCLSIADKMDTLIGIWAVGQQPTGSKDPFALRRAALSVLRILIESELNLDLKALLEQAATRFDQTIHANAAVVEVYSFMMERLRGYFLDQGYSPQQFDAVRQVEPQQPLDFAKRIEAIKQFSLLPQAQTLSAANKRIYNLLKKTEDQILTEVNHQHFVEKEEHNLALAIEHTRAAMAPLIAQGEYALALSQLTTCRETIDNFFAKVMVMTDNKTLRQNRLALLSELRYNFTQIADLSCL